MDGTELDVLVRQARAGRPGASAALVAATERMVYGVARRILHRPEDALDALQTTYLRAFTHLDDLHHPELFAGWLRRIAVTAAWDLRRRRRSTFMESADITDVPVLDEQEERWSDAQRQALAAAILTLSDGERQVCERYYHGGWDMDRLARHEGLTPPAMRKRLQRIRDKLRKEMEMSENLHVGGETLPEGLPAAIAQMLARPRLVDLPENPVGKLDQELRALFPDYQDVPLEEIVDLAAARALLGQDPLYIDEAHLCRIDAQRILRFDMTVPMLLAARGRPAPVRLLASGKVYCNDAPSPRWLQVFHQLEWLVIDEAQRLDPWAFLGSIFRVLNHLWPKASIKVEPTSHPLCSMSWNISLEQDGQSLEVMGGGVYHARIVEFLGLDPQRYTGLGLGCGLERLAGLRYGIDDLRKIESTRLQPAAC